MLRAAVMPLALTMPLTAFAVETASTPATTEKAIIAKKMSPGPDSKATTQQQQLVKEAADAANATHSALEALTNNQPKQALAALQVASGNLHLLLARDPSLGLMPIDMQIQISQGPHDLKTIKQLESDLDDLIDDGQYQAARPIADSLADEIRLSSFSSFSAIGQLSCRH